MKLSIREKIAQPRQGSYPLNIERFAVFSKDREPYETTEKVKKAAEKHIAAQGDVRAAVFGHYHMTDSVSNLKGIDIIQTPGASFSAYGHADVRGVRVITIDESAVNEYSTYVWRFAENEKASSMDDMSFWQRIMQFFRDFWDSIKTILKFGA